MAKAQAVKEPNFIVRYYRETVGELKKVIWPTWPEARKLTIIVLGVIVVTALILGSFDKLFELAFQWFITIKL